MRRLIILFLVAVGLVACGGSDTAQTTGGGSAPTLTIEGRTFGRAPSVGAGDTFNIVNLDSTRHTFSSGNGSWERVEIAANATVPFTIPESFAPGQYVFFCEVHSDMGGTLTVEG